VTLEPASGTRAVVSARPVKRARDFTVALHQPAPGAPARLLLVSLDGRAIAPGRGKVVRLKMKAPGGRRRMRIAAVRAAGLATTEEE
jgi:hypothetical protein